MNAWNGFYIEACEDHGIERYNEETGKAEICDGLFCQVYLRKADAEDGEEPIDTFCLAVGHELSDMSAAEVKRAITEYLKS